MDITADDGANPAQIRVLNLNGIGVVGGSSDTTTDGSEALHFQFDGYVRNARYAVFVANNLDADAFVGESFIEAFAGATSLGVVAVNDTGWKYVSDLFGGVAVTGFTVRADVDGFRIDQMAYTSVWDDLAGGTSGLNGVPALTGEGSLVGGSPVSLTLTSAPASSLLLLWISTSSSPLGIFGGTLHAFPFSDQVLLATDLAGSFTGGTSWPVGLPTGTQAWFQFLVQDPSVVYGITLSNGVRGTTP